MTPGVLAIALIAGGLLFGAARELLRSPDGHESNREVTKAGSVPAAARNLGLPDRLRRAGRDPSNVRPVLLAKAFAAAFGVMSGLTIGPVLPSRLGPLMVIAAALAGFFAPDVMLERAARRRHRRMITALPDALDLLSVSVATGRSLGASLSELAVSGRGPLAHELAKTGQDMAWGTGQKLALDGLKQRIVGKEIASLTANLERSRKLGSPLADQLRRQSAALRQDQRRAIEEEAARAAPKIQLVIALILVPSVLLLIVAALVANSDAIFNAGLV